MNLNSSNKSDNRYYMLNVNASCCFVDIRINDVPLFFRNVEDKDYAAIPINPLIVAKGEQMVSILLKPCNQQVHFPKESDFVMTISTFILPQTDDYIELETAIERTEKHLLSFVLEEEYKTEPLISRHATFNADVPYVLDAWQNSINLKDIRDVKILIGESCRKLKQLINSKDYYQFFDLMHEREKNNDISLYIETSDDRRIKQMISLFESGYDIEVPVEYEDNIKFFADGRLACCLNEDGSSQISLTNNTTKDKIELEFYFHMKQGSNELTII